MMMMMMVMMMMVMMISRKFYFEQLTMCRLDGVKRIHRLDTQCILHVHLNLHVAQKGYSEISGNRHQMRSLFVRCYI